MLLNLLFLAILAIAPPGCQKDVRPAAVAGAFYPADKTQLSRAVEGYLAGAPKPEAQGDLLALVAPHAGYEFSGVVAGASFAQIKGKDYKTIILIGPSHYFAFQGASVYTGSGMATPLGVVEVDQGLAKSFLDEKAQVIYEPKAHEREHSLEVELPFLQKALKDFKVVPIVVGEPTREMVGSLSKSITKVLREDKRALLVISTDWSHYHDYDTAVRMDMTGIEAVKKLSTFELMSRAGRGETELCGIYPMIVALETMALLGADDVRLIKYANSGDTTGKKDSVVGYAAMGFYRSGKAQSGLGDGQKKALLKLARDTVECYVNTGKTTDCKLADPALQGVCGAFVTLKENGELRGCIGNFCGDGPLYETVRNMAVEACSKDYRFQPVQQKELSRLSYEISVLTPLKRLQDPSDVKVGRDGLYIIKDGKSGVLLPQVPLEFGWDRETFLAQVCIKAGLPTDAWKQGAELYVFQAQVFGDK